MKWIAMFVIWLSAAIGICVGLLFLYDWLICDMQNMIWSENLAIAAFSIASSSILFNYAFGKPDKRS